MYVQRLAALSFMTASAWSRSLDEALSSHDELSAFRELLSDFPDLLSDLDSSGNVTILAPSNSGMDQYNDAIDSQTVDNVSVPLEQVLQYHILNGHFRTDNIPADGAFIPTLLTDERFSGIRHGQVVFGMPTDADDDDASGSFQFYSGWNNHSATGDQDGSLLNIEFDSGIIHMIDKPLVVPPSMAQLGSANHETAAYTMFLLSGGATLNTSEGNDMTFFMPTSHSFWQLAPEIVGLYDDPSDDLQAFSRNLWLYHFINDTTPIYTSRIDHADWITALRRNITFSVEDDGTTWVNNAKVVEANWLVSNGIMHVIDQVLDPDQTDAPAPTGQASGTMAFEVDGPAQTPPYWDADQFPELPEPPRATPTWSEARLDGLAVSSDDVGEDRGDGESEENGSNEASGSEESSAGNEAEAATASSKSVRVSSVVAAVLVWALMFML